MRSLQPPFVRAAVSAAAGVRRPERFELVRIVLTGVLGVGCLAFAAAAPALGGTSYELRVFPILFGAMGLVNLATFFVLLRGRRGTPNVRY